MLDLRTRVFLCSLGCRRAYVLRMRVQLAAPFNIITHSSRDRRQYESRQAKLGESGLLRSVPPGLSPGERWIGSALEKMWRRQMKGREATGLTWLVSESD